jgi:hypothetical protein
MRIRFDCHLAISVGLAVLIGSGAPAAEFFVSPAGRDADPGTRQTPFATVARAQRAARELAGREAVNVFFLVWATMPVTSIGENTASQEVQATGIDERAKL